MDLCLECGEPFERLKPNQRFCPGGKCRIKYHNREKTGGLFLTPILRAGLRALAEAHEISENEMACRMFDKIINATGEPLDAEGIFGRKR